MLAVAVAAGKLVENMVTAAVCHGPLNIQTLWALGLVCSDNQKFG